jgi:Cupredoxin-like domain
MMIERVSRKGPSGERNSKGKAAMACVAFGAIAVGAITVMGGHAAADTAAATIKFENHHWAPLNVDVPANRALTIQVVNASNETIEFESFKLNRETAMTPGETITVHLPALSPGNYDFYDDFHQDVPEGAIVAK